MKLVELIIWAIGVLLFIVPAVLVNTEKDSITKFNEENGTNFNPKVMMVLLKVLLIVSLSALWLVITVGVGSIIIRIF